MITVSNLQKIINNHTVLDIAQLEVQTGEIIAIIGPTDSGSKEFFEILIGKISPSAGKITIAGETPEPQANIASKIGVMFPEDGLYIRQTPVQNLSFYARLHNIDKHQVISTLQAVGLSDHHNITVENLPSGLARRLAYGRAILHNPSVLILSDPFIRCDEATITLLSRSIRQYAEHGGTILIFARDPAHLNPLCDQIYLINQGKLTESYLPEQNLLPGIPFKIPVKLEGKVALINPGDILYVEAEEGRTLLHTLNGRMQTQFTMSDLDDRLNRSGFFRAHRSFLVNLQHVKEVIPYTRNAYTLRLEDDANTEIPLSKSAASELKKLLDF